MQSVFMNTETWRNSYSYSGRILIVASYIPPVSDSGFYQVLLDNISTIQVSL